jgi:hypothetical protein
MPRKHWGSRIRHRMYRAFIAAGDRVVSTSELCRRVWPRKTRFHSEEYKRVKATAAFFADPVGRSATGKGRPYLWRAKDDASEM